MAAKDPVERREIARLGGLSTSRKDGGRYIKGLASRASRSPGAGGGGQRYRRFDDVCAGTPADRRVVRELYAEFGLELPPEYTAGRRSRR